MYKARVGQNRMYTPYMTVYFVISLQKYRIYTVYIWFWPTRYKTHTQGLEQGTPWAKDLTYI